MPLLTPYRIRHCRSLQPFAERMSACALISASTSCRAGSYSAVCASRYSSETSGGDCSGADREPRHWCSSRARSADWEPRCSSFLHSLQRKPYPRLRAAQRGFSRYVGGPLLPPDAATATRILRTACHWLMPAAWPSSESRSLPAIFSH